MRAAVLLGLLSAAAPALAVAQDGPSTESIGVDLNGLVLLDATAPVTANALGAVRADGLPIVAPEALTARFLPLLGQPISAALIADIEAGIVEEYRNAGYPFVAVATPPQEITSGVLNLRVVPFRAGALGVSGAGDAVGARLLAGLRQAPGDLIDADVLEEDLDWLNRNPLRRVEAEFQPGTAEATTDITLVVTEGKPWQGSLGIANTGGEATGALRANAGLIVTDLLGADSVLSYRLTATAEADPRYLGHAVQGTFPTGARSELTVTLTLTDTTEDDGIFRTDSTTEEAVVTWSSALSTFGDWPGTVRLGYEERRQSREVFFGPDLSIDSAQSDTRLLIVGWAHDWRGAPDASGRSPRHSVDIALAVSPGDIGPRNSDADLTAYSQGRATDSSFVYLTGLYTHARLLPNGRSLNLTAQAQFSGDALPDTEQMALGGTEAVRGYGSSDGAFDSAVILRGQLGLTDAPLAFGPVQVGPYAFADIGVGLDSATDDSVTLAGIGLGAAMAIGASGSGSVVLGLPLLDGPDTDAGEPVLNLSFTYRF